MGKIFIDESSKKVIAGSFEEFVKYINKTHQMNIVMEDGLAVFTTKTVYDSATMVEIKSDEECRNIDTTDALTVTIVERLEFNEDMLCEYMQQHTVNENYIACEMAA